MLEHEVFIMHASVIEVDGEGYGFLAHSGTGKTTQTRLWLEHFGPRARVINGDKPLVRVIPDGDGWKFIEKDDLSFYKLNLHNFILNFCKHLSFTEIIRN